MVLITDKIDLHLNIIVRDKCKYCQRSNTLKIIARDIMNA